MEVSEILILIRRIVRAINLESKQFEKNYGVSIPQMMTLRYISKQKDYKVTNKDIKALLQLNASTATGILKRLEKKKWISRLPNPSDKRSTFITLTSEGLNFIKETPDPLQEKLIANLKQLDQKEVIGIKHRFNQIIEFLEATDLDASPIIAGGTNLDHEAQAPKA